MGPVRCVPPSTCEQFTCRLQPLLSTCTCKHAQLVGPCASGAAGRPPGSCSAACILPNDSTLLHVLSAEIPITGGYYSPSFSLSRSTLLERQSPQDTSADIASSAPCILCASSPAHPPSDSLHGLSHAVTGKGEIHLSTVPFPSLCQ